jgi:hypothetical protein
VVDITTRHTSGEEVVGATFVLGNMEVTANGGRVVPSKATTKGARKGKRSQPCHVAIGADNGIGNEEASDFSEECVAAARRDFKC